MQRLTVHKFMKWFGDCKPSIVYSGTLFEPGKPIGTLDELFKKGKLVGIVDREIKCKNNTISIIWVRPEGFDGFTSMGDFSGDGFNYMVYFDTHPRVNPFDDERMQIKLLTYLEGKPSINSESFCRND